MRPPTLLNEDQKERLKFLLSKTKSKGDFQRVQCVLSTGMQKCTRNGNEKCTTLVTDIW